MCLNPITIPNPSRRFVRGVSAPFLRVNCRKCKECIKEQQDAWFVRAQMEYVRCMNAGGQVWFPTLTFNDEHLPIWRDPEHNFECQCVDVDLLKRFRDHFRVNLARMLEKAHLPYDVTNIRFEFVSEYGGEFGRMHHHCLIFVPFTIPEYIMVDCLERAWAYKLEPMKYPVQKVKGKHKGDTYYRYCKDEHGQTLTYKVPKNGFVMWSEKGKTINNAKGIRYVQKYITKPQSWITEFGIDEYEERLKQDIRDYSLAQRFTDKFTDAIRENARKHCRDIGEFFKIDPRFASSYPHLQEIKHDYSDEDALSVALEDSIELLRRWRRCRPRHLQSTFFGIDGIDYYKDKETGEFDIDRLVDGRINLGSSEYGDYKFVDPKNPRFLYNMPTYYFNKIFLTKDEYGLAVKNGLYDEVFSKRFEKSQKNIVESYQPYFTNPSALMAHLAYIGKSREQCNELFKTISSLMRGRSVEDLVLYETVYQDRSLDEGFAFLNDTYFSPAGFYDSSYDNDSLEVRLRKVAIPFMLNQKHLEELRPVPTPERMRVRENWIVDDNVFGLLPCFLDFDLVLNIIHDCEDELGDAIDAAYRYDNERKETIMRTTGVKTKYMSNISMEFAYE